MKLLHELREDDKQVFFELYFLQKDIDLNTLKLQEEEVESVEWMSIDRINELINENLFFPNHAEEVFRTIDILKQNEI